MLATSCQLLWHEQINHVPEEEQIFRLALGNSFKVHV